MVYGGSNRTNACSEIEITSKVLCALLVQVLEWMHIFLLFQEMVLMMGKMNNRNNDNYNDSKRHATILKPAKTTLRTKFRFIADIFVDTSLYCTSNEC
ncbi:MAG TPA: hypothetical protein VJ729_11235 [Nitrososphaeraceae archaeon]|nr:hypothetical protein [Nitrososphaeraceae archaeon]